jgi:hypothetical protein
MLAEPNGKPRQEAEEAMRPAALLVATMLAIALFAITTSHEEPKRVKRSGSPCTFHGAVRR